MARAPRFEIPAAGYVTATGLGDRPPAVDLERLLALMRPSWHRYALCKTPAARGVDFFPARGQSSDPAKAVCNECTARPECAAWALAQEPASLMGVWGGMSQRERLQKRRSRPEAA